MGLRAAGADTILTSHITLNAPCIWSVSQQNEKVNEITI